MRENAGDATQQELERELQELRDELERLRRPMVLTLYGSPGLAVLQMTLVPGESFKWEAMSGMSPKIASLSVMTVES